MLKENGGSSGKENISQDKTYNMIYFGILLAIIWTWVGYEIWRAPLMEETDDGKLITKRPGKKLKDIWRKEY